jgi:ABC-2 type transport system ATP-binding protein
MHAIEIENLSKAYGSHSVLNSISLNVPKGKLTGFLGPNGAGKTTTIRILLGLLKSNSGSVKINGKDCRQVGKQIRAEIGYLPGDVNIYANMTGRSVLKFFAKARRRDCQTEIDRLATAFDLDIGKKVRKYSTGMRQKLGLIQAMMHKPELLILDEPTSALDPLVRKSVFEQLQNVVAEGRTVLFSSHSLDEVEELCDEIVILRGGKIVEHQSIEVLQQRVLKRVKLNLDFSSAKPGNWPSQLQMIREDGLDFEFTWEGRIDELIKWLDDLSVKDLTIERPDLNDLFMTYYKEEA